MGRLIISKKWVNRLKLMWNYVTSFSASKPVTVGICMPESCSPQLFESMLNGIGNANETLFKIPYKKCQLRDDYATYTLTDKIAMYVMMKLLTPFHSFWWNIWIFLFEVQYFQRFLVSWSQAQFMMPCVYLEKVSLFKFE